MTGICGWFDGPDGAGQAGEVTAQLAALGAAAGLAAGGAPLHGAGLHGQGLAAGALTWAGDGMAVLLSEPVGLDGAARNTDARALAAAWRADPAGCLGRVQGSFALAVAEPGRLTLAIDRAGVRPLYVLMQGGVVWFSTRLAALTAVPGFRAAVDDQALFDYLYFHMVPSPGTIYHGVTKLLPGQCLVIEGDRMTARFWWHMDYQDANPAGLADIKDEFRTLLPAVVGTAAGEVDALGCFLSGGTDSSTVVGTLRRLRDAPVPSYSIGFAADGYDEMEYARIAARHFGARAREYYVSAEDIVAGIPLIAGFCDEPFANASIVPAWLCARFAREDGMTHLLGGDGGDEIFGGNERYATQAVFERYGRVPAVVRGLLERGVALPGLAALPPVRKARSYIAQAQVPLPDRFSTYNFLHRTPLAEIFTAGFLGRVDTGAPLENLREVYGRTDSAAVVNRMMHLDLKITLADNDLRKVNQACELAGIAVRYPLLDDRMLAFAASVPPGMQLKGARLRWFFKEALRDFLPPEIIRKRKQGFGTPVGLWMTEHAGLRELTMDSISAFRQRGIVQPGYIDWILRQHQENHASYYGVMLWVWVMLERWLAARDL